MRERVVFEPSALGGPPPGVQVEELGKLAGKGRWLVVTDEALDAYEKAEKRLPLLYFTREAYVKAMRKLSPAQVEEAVAARLRYWSPQAMNKSLSLLYLHDEELLVATATALSRAPAGVQAALRGLFDRALTRMAKAPMENFGRMPLPAAIALLQEHEVGLIADATSLATDAPGSSAFADPARNKAYVTACDDILKSLNASDRSMSRLWVGVQRVFLLTPMVEEYATFARRELGTPVQAWGGGVVALDVRRRFEPMLEGDHKLKLELVGFSKYRFFEDVYDITTAQSQVALDESIAFVRSKPLDAAREHWRTLVFEQAILRRGLWLSAKGAGSPVAAALGAQVAEETAYLTELLRSAAPIHYRDAVAHIQAVLANAVADAGFALRQCLVAGRDPMDYYMMRKEIEAERVRAIELEESRP